MNRPNGSDAAPIAARAWVIAAIANQPRAATSDVAELLGRLCRAVVWGFEVAGAAVELKSGPDSEAIAAVSDEKTHRHAQLEFDLGEGPSRAAHAQGRPISVPDLSASTADAWPGWGAIARTAGLQAVFAFPMQVGAAMFGVLTLYSTVARTLNRVEFVRCLAMAELATEILLASSDVGADGELDPSLEGVLGFRNEVYQAQGVIMAALEISLADALARMRAHAFVSGRDLPDVALDIVAGGAPPERRQSLMHPHRAMPATRRGTPS